MVYLRIALLGCLVLLMATPARADRVVLKNGGSLTGKIVREDKREIELLLDDGMRMTISKSRVESISRTVKPSPVPPELLPDPEPEKPPEPEDDPKKEAETGILLPGPPRFFENTPAVDWDVQFSRVPSLTVARTVRFRAYEFVSQDPLAVDPTAPRFADLVRNFGHGGSVSVWNFQYVGNLELRYRDEVKLVAEITAPPNDDQLLLIRLEQGPQPFASRVVVLLVHRNNETKRLVTTTTFTSRDFRTADIAALQGKAMPVRTYSTRYEPVQLSWLLPEESDMLRDLQSPFGNSVRIRLARLRFRLGWYGKAPADRPPLDPDLLGRNAVKPLALPGRPVATEKEVLRAWGNEAANREKLVRLLKSVRAALGRVGIKPGSDYYVEQDRIGTFGRRGVTVETRRHVITRELLDSLTSE